MATFLPVLIFLHHLRFGYCQRQDTRQNRLLAWLNADTILFIMKLNDFYVRVTTGIHVGYIRLVILCITSVRNFLTK